MLSKEATGLGLLAERFPCVFCLGQGDAGCSIPPSPPRRPFNLEAADFASYRRARQDVCLRLGGATRCGSTFPNGSHRLSSPVWQFVAGAQLAGHVVRPVAFKERRWITISRCHPPARFLLSHTETAVPGSFMPDRLLVGTEAFSFSSE